MYDEEACGGLGHVVLDDWNLEDESIQLTLDELEADAAEFTPEHVAAVRACMEAMMACTLEESASGLALLDGFIMDIIPIIGERT